MTARGIRIKIQEEDEDLIMHLHGNLDGSSACEVEHVLERLEVGSRGSGLKLDLAGIARFEYFGVAILARGIRCQRHRFRRISLGGLDGSMGSVFKRFGLEDSANS